MSRCEDFPCCGHELGCCPDYDAAGRQLNMKCTCGAVLPLTSRYSICSDCMRRNREIGEDMEFLGIDDDDMPDSDCDDDDPDAYDDFMEFDPEFSDGDF